MDYSHSDKDFVDDDGTVISILLHFFVNILSSMGHSVSSKPELIKLETRPSQIFTRKLPYELECVISIHAKF